MSEILLKFIIVIYYDLNILVTKPLYKELLEKKKNILDFYFNLDRIYLKDYS